MRTTRLTHLGGVPRAVKSGMPTPQREQHAPERTCLHKLISEHLAEFLRSALEKTGRALPAFVVKAWRGFLDCGLGGAGFRRFSCEKCEAEQLVCFSCKARQLCP